METQSELPREIQVALSYLDDVDEKTEKIKANDNFYINESEARRIQQSELALAKRELDKLAAHGMDVGLARSLVLFKEGNLSFSVACSANSKSEIERWAKQAATSYEESIRLDESAVVYYNLGLTYDMLSRETSAIQAFRKVEQLGDNEISIKATKAIHRLDPHNRVARSLDANPTSSQANSINAVGIASGKRINWNMAKNGLIATVIGLFLAGFHGFGIPILLIGIGMIVYAVAVGLPT